MTNQIPAAGSRRPDWTRYLWVLLAVFLAAQLYGIMAGPQALDLSYSEFKSRLEAGAVESVVIDGNEISGELAAEADGKEKTSPDPEQTPEETKDAEKRRSFHTVMPAFGDPELMTLLEEQDVRIDAKAQGRHWLVTVLAALLPWVLIFGIFYYFSQRMQKRMQMGKSGGVFGFGKSKAKLHTRSISELSFMDVAGMKNVKRELKEMVEYLRNPSRFQSLGGELPKGVLLVGPPGTGKTLMARAVAGEAEVPFYSISGSEFIEMFVGVGASRVRDMFEQAKKESPAIIFIDELDSIGRVRGTGLGGGHDEREQTLNQILSEMDGFSPTESVVVMAATNRPDVLDPALVRPGRFDRQIQVDLPRKSAREKILALHAKDVPLDDDVDLGAVAGLTVGFSGADLKNLVNEAALLAARKEKKTVGQEMTEPRDFSEETAKLIDEEVRRIIVEAEEKAEQMLSESRDRLDRLAEALLEQETLSNVEVDDLLGAVPNT